MNQNNLIPTTFVSSENVSEDQNPLLQPWSGNYGGYPAFDKVKIKDFLPAFEVAMKEGLNEIEKIANNPAPPTFENTMLELVSKFENAPYLWGGKTILGMDCSGLMQLIYKPFSIDLPRNASQQEMAGDLITFGSHRAGDVAFFANENNKVVHVGILSSTDLIWHASGCVRLDGFIREGIFNRDTDLISHRLYSIRRFA